MGWDKAKRKENWIVREEVKGQSERVSERHTTIKMRFWISRDCKVSSGAR
jgi:hypothetical protein